ncbi:MAG: NADH dehydrogenase subunit, partial [Candidatus Riflebacteria bacterium]|nr:NADH dehydrogenase subunit [Candidatus Riflebacteria bacterium]
VLGTHFCCECGLCTLYACPEDLDPRNACIRSKLALRASDRFWPADDLKGRRWVEHPLESFRHIPLKKLISKLKLAGFSNVGPLVETQVRPDRLRLPLKQHLGAPSVPTVRPGDRVVEGQLIAKVPEGKLGAPIHAPLSGTVQSVEGEIVLATT